MNTSAVTDLRVAPIGVADTEKWARLCAIIGADDASTHTPTATELVEGLAPSPSFDPATQTWAIWDGEEMVAYAEVFPRTTPAFDGTSSVRVFGGVLPAWRGRGLGSYLLDLAEARGAEIARAHLPHLPPIFAAYTTDSAPAASGLLHERGYREVRYWFDMAHDLRGTFAHDPRTQPITPEFHEALRLAHNDAFSTHWGSGPVSAEVWPRIVGSAGFRPDLSRIIIDGDDVLAYTVVSSVVPSEAYFDLIGVRGSAQGSGLGRAVLHSSLAAIQADGSFTKAELDVDADNPSGAGRLYSSTGFVNVARKISWEKRGE